MLDCGQTGPLAGRSLSEVADAFLRIVVTACLTGARSAEYLEELEDLGLQWDRGGGVIVYAREPATLSNGDHLQVEGIFETQHRRDGSLFNNEMQATKIITLPR